MKRRLGRGLGSLLGAGGLAEAAPEVAATQEAGRGAASEGDGPLPREGGAGPSESVSSATTVPVDLLRSNPFQPRDSFDGEALQGLCQSLKRHGFLQPLCVRASMAEPGVFEVISGERRWRAAVKIGLDTVPVTVRAGVDDEMMLELALVENLQREDLTALERARGFRAMINELGLTQEQVADRVSLKRATVANHLRLLELPETARAALERGLISMGHARALLGLDSEGAMRTILGRTVREGLSVRALEALVRKRTGSRSRKEAVGSKTAGPSREAWVAAIESRLRESLGTRAVIQNRAGYRGSIQIEYHDRDELDRILDRLAPQRTV